MLAAFFINNPFEFILAYVMNPGTTLEKLNKIIVATLM